MGNICRLTMIPGKGYFISVINRSICSLTLVWLLPKNVYIHSEKQSMSVLHFVVNIDCLLESTDAGVSGIPWSMKPENLE